MVNSITVRTEAAKGDSSKSVAPKGDTTRSASGKSGK
jgi:hypothetical protein